MAISCDLPRSSARKSQHLSGVTRGAEPTRRVLLGILVRVDDARSGSHGSTTWTCNDDVKMHVRPYRPRYPRTAPSKGDSSDRRWSSISQSEEMRRGVGCSAPFRHGLLARLAEHLAGLGLLGDTAIAA